MNKNGRNIYAFEITILKKNEIVPFFPKNRQHLRQFPQIDIWTDLVELFNFWTKSKFMNRI